MSMMKMQKIKTNQKLALAGVGVGWEIQLFTNVQPAVFVGMGVGGVQTRTPHNSQIRDKIIER